MMDGVGCGGAGALKCRIVWLGCLNSAVDHNDDAGVLRHCRSKICSISLSAVVIVHQRQNVESHAESAAYFIPIYKELEDS
jgi:hypothetical protein